MGDILDGENRRRGLLRFWLIVALLAVMPLLLGFGPPAYVESDQAHVPLLASDVPQVLAAVPPEVSATAAVAIDGKTGRVLYEKDAHARRAPASMTKVATAIVALEHGGLDDMVGVTVNGWAMEGSSVMGLTPGELISLKGLLTGLMVPSGNDAALAIAEQVGGTVERFVEMMNAKVAQLGLNNSHFVNPHGLDEEDHYSSAYDLAQMARYAMDFPAFAELVKLKQAVIEAQNNTYYMQNTNPLLGTYDGVDGVKTGYTEAAGYCVVASATREGRRVFVTLMDSDDRVGDGSSLFDYSFNNYVEVTLGLPDSPFYTVLGPNDERLPAKLSLAQTVCLPSWQQRSIVSEVRLNLGPDGQVDVRWPVGEVVFYAGDLPPITVALTVDRR